MIRLDGEPTLKQSKNKRYWSITFRYLNPKTNKRDRTPTRRAYVKTKSEARREAEKIRQELEHELNHINTADTLVAYAERFHKERVESGDFSPETLARDETQIKRIREYFGEHMRLKDLTTQQVKDVYEQMRQDGLSKDAVHRFHQKLKQILSTALDDEIVLKNACAPIKNITRPKTNKRKALAKDQITALARDLMTSPKDGKIVAVWIALSCGVRRGEALGLVWGNVSLDSKKIRIEKQIDAAKRRRDPKTEQSIREFCIDGTTVEFLSEWKHLQSIIFFSGGCVPDDFPVCSSQRGDFLSPAHFDKWRRGYFAEHGLGTFTNVEEYYDAKHVKRYRATGYEGFTLHELRHTWITLMLESGHDVKSVQQHVGQENLVVTYGYHHPTEEQDQKQADYMGQLLNGS